MFGGFFKKPKPLGARAQSQVRGLGLCLLTMFYVFILVVLSYPIATLYPPSVLG